MSYIYDFICTQCTSRITGGECDVNHLSVGQQEVSSNVKCMYCNKHVNLKKALVYWIIRAGSYTSALLKVLSLVYLQTSHFPIPI